MLVKSWRFATLSFSAHNMGATFAHALELPAKPIGFVRSDDGSVGWAASSPRLVPKVEAEHADS